MRTNRLLFCGRKLDEGDGASAAGTGRTAAASRVHRSRATFFADQRFNRNETPTCAGTAVPAPRGAAAAIQRRAGRADAPGRAIQGNREVRYQRERSTSRKSRRRLAARSSSTSPLPAPDSLSTHWLLDREDPSPTRAATSQYTYDANGRITQQRHIRTPPGAITSTDDADASTTVMWCPPSRRLRLCPRRRAED
jgi:hypothetical protein